MASPKSSRTPFQGSARPAYHRPPRPRSLPRAALPGGWKHRRRTGDRGASHPTVSEVRRRAAHDWPSCDPYVRVLVLILALRMGEWTALGLPFAVPDSSNRTEPTAILSAGAGGHSDPPPRRGWAITRGPSSLLPHHDTSSTQRDLFVPLSTGVTAPRRWP